MKKTMHALILAPLLIAACQENPVQNRAQRQEVDTSASRSIVPGPRNLPCNRAWAIGVDGDWEDAAKWNPPGVPTSTDNVCIMAPGTYTVTVSSNQSVYQMQLGGTGTAATLRLALPMGDSLRVNGRAAQIMRLLAIASG